MSLNLQNIKHIDVKSRVLMNGYLRSLFKESEKDDIIIPDLVLHICLLFYYQREYFSFIINGHTRISQNFVSSDDKKTMSLVDNCYGTVYGDIKIDSLSEVICRWDIRVRGETLRKTQDLVKYMIIGISGDEPKDEFKNWRHSYNILQLPNTFACGGQILDARNIYGAKECVIQKAVPELTWNDGDIVGIKLDLKQRNIEYFVNDENIAITHKNLPIGKDIKYRLGIIMNHDGNCATIESHQYL